MSLCNAWRVAANVFFCSWLNEDDGRGQADVSKTDMISGGKKGASSDRHFYILRSG